MSAAKSIDVRSWCFTLFVVCIASSVPGCSPRELIHPVEKTESNADAGVGLETKLAQESPQPHKDGKLPSRPSDLTPSGPKEVVISNSDGTADQVIPLQLPPTNALELRRETKQLAEELIQRYPRNPDSLEIKARFLMLFGETEEAKKCWLAATNIDPTYAYALHGLGKIAILNSDFEQAIAYLKNALSRQPNNEDLVHDLSDTYLKLGKLDESVGCLQAFAENNPKSMLTQILLGQSYLAKEQFEEAESAFRFALKISPGQPRAENGLATVLIRLGKRDEAKTLLTNQKASREANTKSRPLEVVLQDELKDLSERFNTVAEFYSTHGNHERAEQVARRALILNGENLQAKALLVEILHKQNRLKESLDLLDQLSVADSKNPRWPYTRGVFQSLLGNRKAARQAYEKVVQLAPTSTTGYEALARLAIGAREDLPSAILNAQKAVEIRGSAADHELLAQAYAVNSDYQKAHESLIEAIRQDANNKNYIEAMKQLKTAMGISN